MYIYLEGGKFLFFSKEGGLNAKEEEFRGELQGR